MPVVDLLPLICISRGVVFSGGHVKMTLLAGSQVDLKVGSLRAYMMCDGIVRFYRVKSPREAFEYITMLKGALKGDSLSGDYYFGLVECPLGGTRDPRGWEEWTNSYFETISYLVSVGVFRE